MLPPAMLPLVRLVGRVVVAGVSSTIGMADAGIEQCPYVSVSTPPSRTFGAGRNEQHVR